MSLGPVLRAADAKAPPFKISLAEWSLHKALFGKKITNLDFPRLAKSEFGILACEYVNQFWMDKAKDAAYLAELKKITEGEGVTNVLIMCDNEGNLGDPDKAKRRQAVENHFKWGEAAKALGCHSIRVNARSSGSYEEQMNLAADGLHQLAEFGATLGINVIVENHGGLSSNGAWLAATIRKVDLKNCGTLPDFGNFTIDRAKGEEYDRYKGVEEMMPFAKGVSAKTHDFDDAGNETQTDYRRMMKIVLAAGYHGYVGIEYEGSKIDEYAGIRATKKLLDAILAELAKQ
jgi:sugar phosphate isomerase/epimerase